MALNETFRASVIGQLDDGTGTVFDFGYADLNAGIEHVDTLFAAGQFQTLVQAAIVACMPTDWKVVKYRFACVGGTHAGEVGWLEVATPVEGERSAALRAPNEIAIGLKRSTGHTSRRDRGRIFLGPVPAGLISLTNPNIPLPENADIEAVRDLLKANLVLSGYILRPAIIAANGTWSGRTVINVGISPTLLHRKSRRPRVGA